MSHISTENGGEHGQVSIWLNGNDKEKMLLCWCWPITACTTPNGFEAHWAIHEGSMPTPVLDWVRGHGRPYNVVEEYGGWLCRDLNSALALMHGFRDYMIEFDKLHRLAIMVG